jgi:hypothetical protein
VLSTALQKICCDIVLASLANHALTVSEAAVAFENAGYSIDLFPHTLRTAKQKNLVRSDAAGRLTLTARGKLVAATEQSSGVNKTNGEYHV